MKYRMKINNINCFDKKQSVNLQKDIKKTVNRIEKYKQCFNRQEYEHYIDLFYIECSKKQELDPPEHQQYATFN